MDWVRRKLVGLLALQWLLALAALLLVMDGAAAHADEPTPTSTETASVVPTASPTLAGSVTPTPSATAAAVLLVDANCDQRSSAADFVAAVVVSYDPTQFPTCSDADFFRNRDLTDRDFIPLLSDLFSTFAAPWTPTRTLSPTITPTPTISATGTPIATPTPTRRFSATPTRTRTAPPTASPSATPTQTPTNTATPIPTRTATQSATATQTSTPRPLPTRTPTGLAYQLSGDWFVDWANPVTAICFSPNGQPFFELQDAVYSIAAVNGRLDVTAPDGTPLARGVSVSNDGQASFEYVFGSGESCFGIEPQFVFDFSFTFRANGTGFASAHWTYGLNTNCFVCDKTDIAVLTRRTGPPA